MAIAESWNCRAVELPNRQIVKIRNCGIVQCRAFPMPWVHFLGELYYTISKQEQLQDQQQCMAFFNPIPNYPQYL
jgi:hypothetical protein